MLKRSKKILAVLLSLTLMLTFTSSFAQNKNSAVYAKTKKQAKIHDFKKPRGNVKAIPTPEQTPEPIVATCEPIDITGFVSEPYDKEKGTFILKTNNEAVLLTGNTQLLFEYIDKSIMVRGNYIDVKSGSNAEKIFEVSEVFPDCLRGTINSAIDMKKSVYELECSEKTVVLSDASGLEKYLGSQIEVFGGYTGDKVNGKPVFGVHHYYPMANEKFEGHITRVLDEKKQIYEMKSEKGYFAIVKNTPNNNGELGAFVGKDVFVAGLFVNYTFPEYPEHSVFEVLYFSGPNGGMPEKETLLNSDVPGKTNYSVHTVISEDPIYIKEIFPSEFINAKGNITICWKDDSEEAFFNAVVTGDNGSNYIFSLESAQECTDDCITGLFNIEKDGVLVASKIHGMVYGIGPDKDNGFKGKYFKFYSDGEGWHVSGNITYRYDY